MENNKFEWHYGDHFEGLILETCRDSSMSRPRVRPLENSDIRVDFPRKLREDYPLGTRFQADVKVTQKTRNDAPYGKLYLAAKNVKLVDSYTPDEIIRIIKIGDRTYEYFEESNLPNTIGLLRKRAYENATNTALSHEAISVRMSRLYNNDLLCYVLARSNGFCEACGAQAPFLRKNGEPYLEIHHIVEVCNGGANSPENIAALCPNCHRKVTYGIDSDSYNMEIRQKIEEKEKNSF